MADALNDRKAVLSYLMHCDSVAKLSVGAVVNGFVRHDYVVVHEAAPRVVREIVTNFRMVSLTSDGLMIPLRAPVDTDT